MLLLIPCAAFSAEPRTISGIHVSTDRSVDFFSRETILKSIIKPDMTDEQKAIACWDLVRTRIYHFCRPDDNDPMRVLNVYGYALCGTIQHTLVWLGQGAIGPDAAGPAGLSSRKIADPETFRIAASGWLVDSFMRKDATKPPAGLGHSWCQFFYGGRYHYLDAHAGMFVYTADGKSIASVEDFIVDSTLLTDPVKTSEPFMPCDGGRPEFFYRCSGGGFSKTVEKTAHSMALTVRPGETLEFNFDKLSGGHFKRSGSWTADWNPDFYAEGPHHRCAGPNEKSWRHYGNGEILYKPDLTKAGFKEALAESANLASFADDGKPGLHPADATKAATATFAFATPYVMVGGTIDAEFDLPAGSTARVTILPAGVEKNAQLVGALKGEGGRKTLRTDLDMQKLGYPYGAHLRVELSGGDKDKAPALIDLTLRIITQLNFSTLPRPLPGDNKVAVECAAGSPKASGLQIRWLWLEADGRTKDDVRAVTDKTFAYDLKLGPVATTPAANPKYMRSLRLSIPDR